MSMLSNLASRLWARRPVSISLIVQNGEASLVSDTGSRINYGALAILMNARHLIDQDGHPSLALNSLTSIQFLLSRGAALVFDEETANLMVDSLCRAVRAGISIYN